MRYFQVKCEVCSTIGQLPSNLNNSLNKKGWYQSQLDYSKWACPTCWEALKEEAWESIVELVGPSRVS